MGALFFLYMSVKLKINPNENVFRIHSLKNRIISDVVEYRIKKSDTGERYVGWYGSTECEYFSIVFLGGIVSMSLEERMMHIGHESILALMSDRLYPAALGTDVNEKVLLWADYNKTHLGKELETISFKDIMRTLSWKLKSKVKIEYDLVDSGFYINTNDEQTSEPLIIK